MSYFGVDAVAAGQEALLQYAAPVQADAVEQPSTLFAEVLAAEMDTQMMRLAAHEDEFEEDDGTFLFSTDITDLAMSSMLKQEAVRAPEEALPPEEPAAAASEDTPEPVLSNGGLVVSSAYAGPPIVPRTNTAPTSVEEAYTQYEVSEPYMRSSEELQTARELAADYALGREGDPYSQARRGQGSYVDCSSLTQWAYRQAGFSIPSTAAEQARYCASHDYVIPTSDLQKGDLIFWERKDCSCGRYDEIHHVALYLGDGRIVEASSSRGCVVENNIWGEDGLGSWKIAMCARPA